MRPLGYHPDWASPLSLMTGYLANLAFTPLR